MSKVECSNTGRASSDNISTKWRNKKVLMSGAARGRHLLSVAAASALAFASMTRAADTADYVNLNATSALDTAANYSLNALPGTTNDMVFVNGTYANTAFTLNTTALTPGTLDDLDVGQLLSISGTKSITLKTLGNATLNTAPADLLYVAAGGNLNISNAVVLGLSGGSFDIVGTSSISGVISGAFTLAKSGGGTLNLSAAETYTGATTLANGNLNLNFVGTGAPTSNILVNSAMTLQNGTLTLTGAAGATNTQSLGAVTLNNAGFVTINAVPGAGGTAALTMASFARTTSANSDAVGGGVQFNTTGSITITGTLNSALLVDASANPYATFGTDDWAATNATGQVIAAATSAYTDLSANSTAALNANAVRLSNTLATGPITIAQGNVTGTARGILVTSQSAGGTISGGFIRPNRVSTAGAQFIVIENAPAAATPGGVGDLTIASSLSVGSSSTPVAFVKSGPGRVLLTSTANAQARDFIDGGFLDITADLNLGIAGGDLVFDGGTLEVNGTFAPATNRANILNANSGISVLGTNTFTDPGVLSGLGSITKSGSGTLVLTNANTYSGGTTVTGGTLNINGLYALGGGNFGGLNLNGGTLQYVTNIAGVSNGGADFSGYGNGITVGANGATIDLNGNPITLGGALHDGGGVLNIVSSDASHGGVLTLAGNSTIANGISINSGSLAVTGNLGTTPVSVNSATTLFSTGTVGPLTLNGGTVATGLGSPFLNVSSASSVTYNSGAFEIGIGTSASGNISTGVATFNSIPTFNFVLSGSPASGSVYTILNSTSAIVDNGNLTGLTPTNIGRLTLTPSESGSHSIIVTLSGNAGNLVWNNGASTGMWNIQTDKNFLNSGTNSQDYYYEGDNVTFNDTNGGNYTVGIASAVNPGSVVVNNSGGDYVFNGPGYIAGGTSLTKSGSRMLTLNESNTYSGGTTITGGTLQLGVAGALPSAGAVTLSGAVLDLNGNNQTIGGLSDGGSTSGNITSAGPAILTLNSTASINTFGGTITGAVGINKTGISTFTLSNSNSYTGMTNISSGTLIVANDSALGNSSSTSGGLYTSATGFVSFTTATPSIASLSGTGGTVSLASSTGTMLTVGLNGASTTYGGVISDISAASPGVVGSLTVTGGGNLTLSGVDTFTGQTIIANGSTLTTGNALALQDSILNYSTGTFSFGTLTAATVGGLIGLQNLTLANNASVAATLSVGGGNMTSSYAGSLTGAGGLTKIGSGSFTLAGTSSYSGQTNVAAGPLIIPAGGSVTGGAFNTGAAGASGAQINVSGGTLVSSATSVINANSSGFVLTSGSATFNGGITAQSSGTDGEFIDVQGGTFIASTVTLTRNAAYNALQTAPVATSGFYVTNGVVGVTSLLIGTSNSSASARIDGGAVTIATVTEGNTTNTRYNVLDVNGGTLVVTDPTAGITLSVNASTANNSELLVSGGAATVSVINMGSSTSNASSSGDVVVNGGTLLMGSGGIVLGSSAPSTFNAAIGLTSGTLGAAADWSTSLPIALNGSAGTNFTVQAADALAVAHNITLTGNLSGTGGLTKTGTGNLTLSSSSYTGATTVTAGNLILNGVSALASGTNLNISGGASVIANNLGSPNGLKVGTLTVAGTLDLMNNALVVHSSDLPTVNAMVASGYNNGHFNGSVGIISSTAAADSTHLTAVGVILNTASDGVSILKSSLDGQNGLTASDVLVKYTYFGDTNFDGKVDASDYSQIDSGFLTHATGWFNGDFNYDNVINGSDYTLIDNAFNSQTAVLASQLRGPVASIAAQVGGSAVPEPTTLGLLGIGAAGLLGRRRRSK